MRIEVLVLDNAFDTGLSTVLDAFATANMVADAPPFEVVRTGMRRKVKTAQGFAVPVTEAESETVPDWLVIPAIACKMPGPIEQGLGKPDVRDGLDFIRSRAQQGVAVAAACVGSFVLAESGLLDQQAATTSWWLAPYFRERYPRVRLDESRIVVRSGKYMTAGAALSHMDLALAIIRQKSPRVAALTARYLVVDPKTSQSSYVLADHLAHADPLVERFERWARARLSSGFSLDHAAAAVRTSKRTLARRMQDVLGKSPLSYFQDLRVERAVHLLRTTDENVDEIAARVGYADGVTLRTLLRKRLGHGVKEIRRNS